MLHGEAVVMRLLRQGDGRGGVGRTWAWTRASMKSFREACSTCRTASRSSRGPTGSGKTTTLYSALNQINDSVRKIITIEDPVEYQLKGINQIQVSEKAGLTFGKGICARFCVTIPTWCSSVKSAIRKRRRSPCRRR